MVNNPLKKDKRIVQYNDNDDDDDDDDDDNNNSKYNNNDYYYDHDDNHDDEDDDESKLATLRFLLIHRFNKIFKSNLYWIHNEGSQGHALGMPLLPNLTYWWYLLST